MITNEQFFDEAAEYYNSMVNFDDAFIKREKALKNFITDNMKTAADIGCGTGVDSLSLAKNGLKVTAFDISEKMLEKAEAKAKENGLKIDFIKSPADKIPENFHNKFPLVVSLGNTFVNMTRTHLGKTLKTCYNILTDDGTLLIQILNFSRILKNKERIINITRSGDFYYTRFYDFMDKELYFNILKFNGSNPAERNLITTSLYPHSYLEIKEYLQKAGFSEIKLWENFARKLFEPAESKDLIVEAVK